MQAEWWRFFLRIRSPTQRAEATMRPGPRPLGGRRDDGITSDRPAATSSIAISEPVLGEEVERLILKVLRSGQLSQGPMVERFEGLVAEMAGTKHAVALANGTIALEAALELRDVGRGDEVITSPLTFGATLNAILHRGANVRFADVLQDFTLDPARWRPR